jgi:hypothetical protein
MQNQQKNSNLLSTLLILGGGLLALFTWKKLANLSTLQNELQYYITGRLQSISLSGIGVRLNMAIHNPTDVEVPMTKPVIRLYYNDIEIAATTPTQEVYTIERKTVTNIPNINMNIPLSMQLIEILQKAGVNIQQMIITKQLQPLGINLKAVAIFDIDNIKNVRKEDTISI